jgi:hypothetical protein
MGVEYKYLSVKTNGVFFFAPQPLAEGFDAFG